MIIRKEVLFLLVFLLGLNVLFGVIIFIEQEITPVKDISEKMLDKKIVLEGKIISSIFFNDSSFEIIDIEDKIGKISGVFNTKEKKVFNKTQDYIISGKVSLYKNETQIAVDKISAK